MPLYFFDTIENGQITRDDLGVEMSPCDMREEAKRLLPAIVADHPLPADSTILRYGSATSPGAVSMRRA
ncbi:DUF6894 family protein [Mesorhizobium sp. CO1-1-7]|uniref:DUF6894 family protein n=1 Tax=Mesorhizobium sp. CO1-1-7 TaxID=2876632 RepID=UPI00398C85B5